MRSRFAYTICVALLSALMMSGCTQAKTTLQTTLAPKSQPASIQATVAAPGAAVDGAVEASFPTSVPLWPQAKVEKSKTTKTPGGEAYTLVLKTADTYADVLAGVGAGVKSAGWKASITDAGSVDASASIVMISSPGYDGVITISVNPDDTRRIEYNITPR